MHPECTANLLDAVPTEKIKVNRKRYVGRKIRATKKSLEEERDSELEECVEKSSLTYDVNKSSNKSREQRPSSDRKRRDCVPQTQT